MPVKKKYRKICHHCGVNFKGGKNKKYCCNSCKQLKYLEGNRYGYVKALKDILEVELGYLKGGELKKVVEVCGYVVRKVVVNNRNKDINVK